EFGVNSTTAGDQVNPSVAMDPAGDFVVAWQSASQDGSGYGVYAQRYEHARVGYGPEFRGNSTTADNQEYTTVAMDSAGDFVVAWASYSQDGSGWGVYAQRYNAGGMRLYGEFRVNSTTAGNQTNPTVAMDSAGDFVVAWESYGQDGSGYGIYAQ